MLLAKLRSFGFAVLWTSLLLGSLPALAEEDSWVFATAVTGPMERVEACFEELGAPLPRFLQREAIEEDMAFIGPGGLRAGGSLGMSMGPGEPGSTNPGTLLFFPVKPDVLPVSKLISRGAKLLEGSSDAVRIKGTLLRRAKGFVVIGGSEEGIVDLKPLAIEERLAAPGLLADIELDFGRWRTEHPSSFYQLLSSRRPGSDEGDGTHTSSLGKRLGMQIYEKLVGRVRLTLTDAGSSLRLSTSLEPLAPGDISMPKPAFPSPVLGRLDIAYSSTEGAQWLHGMAEEFVLAMDKDGIFDKAVRDGVDTTEVQDLFKEAIEIFWIADSVSLAVEHVKGKLIYHQVNQYRSPADFTTRLTSVVKRLNAFDKRNNRRPSFGLTTYKIAGARITRITRSQGKHALDIAESGTTVRIVAAADTQRRLPTLLELPDEGTLTSGFSGSFDPSAAAKAYIAEGKYLPLALSHWPDGASGKLITWSTRAEGQAAVVDLDVPKPVAQVLLQFLGGSGFGMSSTEL